MNAQVSLHPQMTAQQIAEFCRRHHMYVVIDWGLSTDGRLVPLMSPRRETPSIFNQGEI